MRWTSFYVKSFTKCSGYCIYHPLSLRETQHFVLGIFFRMINNDNYRIGLLVLLMDMRFVTRAVRTHNVWCVLYNSVASRMVTCSLLKVNVSFY